MFYLCHESIERVCKMMASPKKEQDFEVLRTKLRAATHAAIEEKSKPKVVALAPLSTIDPRSSIPASANQQKKKPKMKKITVCLINDPKDPSQNVSVDRWIYL